MSYLFAEILTYLLIAGLIGFIVGWVVKGGSNSTKEEKTSNESQLSKASTPETVKSEDKEEDKEIEPDTLEKARDEGKDKLSLIKGIGPVLEKKLNQLGIYHFDQIASWSTEEQTWINTQIQFPKKVEREEWVKQAKELS